LNLSLLLFGIVLPWIIVGLFVVLGCWIGFQLIHQNGRLLSRLEALEGRLGQLSAAPAPLAPAAPAPPLAPAPPTGLPVGAAAPAFDLPDLNGERRSLADFLGKKLLLVFFNPRCGFCAQMAPHLAALPVDGRDGLPILLVVTTGEAEENRKLVEEHGIRCPVLLQEGMEIAAQYQAHGTPMGCLIDEHGQIASELAAGAPALLALLNEPAHGSNGHAPVGSNGHGPAALGGKRSLAESRIQRNGLPPGTPAPNFTLPRLDCGELSLEEYRGQKVLLVFSDPNCGPCDALMPQLERAYRASADVEVLMVSRGDEEANRPKVAEHGLTFPVVLQRQWEISREYAMFGTPVGYLIDENGLIAADVATGAEAILALVGSVGTVPAPEGRCKCGKPLSKCYKGEGDCECKKQNERATPAPEMANSHK
jgi:peroxiredoxin